MTMIRDHDAVNGQALALLKKLNAQPQDNFLSRQLTEGSIELVDKAFIPNIKNAEVKALFEAGLKTFRIHERHAEMMVGSLT